MVNKAVQRPGPVLYDHSVQQPQSTAMAVAVTPV